MKKLLLTLLVTILSWPAFSQEPSTYSYTFEAVTSGLSGNAKFDNLSLGEITWNYLNVQSSTSTLTVQKDSGGRGWQFGAKSKMPQEVSFSTSDFVGKEIIEIECQIGGDGGSFTYSIDNAPLENANNASYAAASGTTTVAANWTGSMVCNSELKLAINPVQGNGKKALFLKSITIKYQEPSTGDPDKVTPVLTWSETEVTTILGGEFNAPQLTVEPDANKADIVEWLQYYSSDEEVAMIDQNNGEIVINGVGTATIRVELDETAYELYNPAFAEYKLIVTNTPASISCNTTETAVTLGKEEEFVYPNFICDPEELELSDNIVFTSSDPTVATVKNEGLNYTLNFLKAGETTITVSINENGYEPAEASFKLTVVEEGGETPVDPTPGLIATAEFNFTSAEAIKAHGYTTSGQNTILKAEQPITSGIVKITYDKGSCTSTNNSQIINFYNSQNLRTSSNTAVAGQKLTFTADGNTITKIEFTSTALNVDATPGTLTDKTWEGSASEVTFTLTGQIVITNIKVTYTSTGSEEPGKVQPELKWSEENVSVTAGQEFTAPTLSILPAEYTDELKANVKYTSSNEAVATIDEKGNVVLTNTVGSTTITATLEAYDNFLGATASYELTVVEEGGDTPIGPTDPTVIEFKESSSEYKGTNQYTGTFTTNDGMWKFGYFSTNNNQWAFIAGGRSNNASTPYFATQKPSAAAIGTIVVTLESTRYTKSAIDKATLYVADNASFSNATTTDITSNLPATADTDLTISVPNGAVGQYIKVEFTVPSQKSNGKAIAIKRIQINYLDPSEANKKDAGLEFAEAVVNTTTDGEYAGQAVKNPNELEGIAYTSDDEAVATVDAEGKVTLKGKAGNVVISAIFNGNDEYKAQTVTYTINVKAAATSLAQYLELAAENGTEALMNCELVVTYVNGAYVYVTDRDETAYSLIYKFNLGYNIGDVIPAGWSAQTKIYNGLFEIIPTIDMPAATDTAVVNYEIFDAVSEAEINRIVKLENVTFADKTGINKESFNGTFGNADYTFFNQFAISSVAAGDYNMTAVVSYYAPANGTATLQLLPIEYRLTNEKHAGMWVSTSDDKDDESVYAEMGDDIFNAAGSWVFIKFVTKEDGHKVFFRHTPANAAAKVASRAALDGFTEYSEPIEINDNGKFEYYTEDANSGIRTEVKPVQFDGVTGIEDITVDGAEGEATYYNLQGVRIERPAKGGVYVRVAAGKATKVVF